MLISNDRTIIRTPCTYTLVTLTNVNLNALQPPKHENVLQVLNFIQVGPIVA